MKRNLGLFLIMAACTFALTGCTASQKRCNKCNPSRGCGPTGCRPGPIGWQRGGTDYQRHLSHADYTNQQAGSGVPGPATAYPYYTVRGPRDFLLNNPPTIGR